MSWVRIDSTTLESAAASVTFSSGLSGYKFFRLTAYVANDGSGKNIGLRLNGDSGSNYALQRITANSTTVAGARQTSMAHIEMYTGNQVAASNYASYSVLIAKPSASVPAQVVSAQGSNALPDLGLVGGQWGNTAASITSIEVMVSGGSGNFAAGSSFLLEGLAF